MISIITVNGWLFGCQIISGATRWTPVETCKNDDWRQHHSCTGRGLGREGDLGEEGKVRRRGREREREGLTLAEVHFLYWKLGGKQIN